MGSHLSLLPQHRLSFFLCKLKQKKHLDFEKFFFCQCMDGNEICQRNTQWQKMRKWLEDFRTKVYIPLQYCQLQTTEEIIYKFLNLLNQPTRKYNSCTSAPAAPGHKKMNLPVTLHWKTLGAVARAQEQHLIMLIQSSLVGEWGQTA